VYKGTGGFKNNVAPKNKVKEKEQLPVCRMGPTHDRLKYIKPAKKRGGVEIS